VDSYLVLVLFFSAEYFSCCKNGVQCLNGRNITESHDLFACRERSNRLCHLCTNLVIFHHLWYLFCKCDVHSDTEVPIAN